MTEEKIKNLLQKADQAAPAQTPVCSRLTAALRRRANRRRFINITAPIATAATLLITFGVWHLTTRTTQTKQDRNKITSLQAEIKELHARTDATLKLIQEVLDNQRQQRRLDELQAQLANIPKPLEEIQKQVDKTAFILVYQADRMYREHNQKNSAIRAYNRVIELFPQTQSAKVAKQRLSEIQNNPLNIKELKI